MTTRLLELQNFAVTVACKAWANFRAHNPGLLTPCPTIVISKRMKTTAGFCSVEERTVKLCYDLLDLYPKEFRLDTIPHELGHQVAYDVFGIGKDWQNKRIDWHGNDWKRVMISAGYDIGRTHNMVNTRHKK